MTSCWGGSLGQSGAFMSAPLDGAAAGGFGQQLVRAACLPSPTCTSSGPAPHAQPASSPHRSAPDALAHAPSCAAAAKRRHHG